MKEYAWSEAAGCRPVTLQKCDSSRYLFLGVLKNISISSLSTLLVQDLFGYSIQSHCILAIKNILLNHHLAIINIPPNHVYMTCDNIDFIKNCQKL